MKLKLLFFILCVCIYDGISATCPASLGYTLLGTGAIGAAVTLRVLYSFYPYLINRFCPYDTTPTQETPLLAEEPSSPCKWTLKCNTINKKYIPYALVLVMSGIGIGSGLTCLSYS